MSPVTLLNILGAVAISALSVNAQVNDPTQTFPATPLAQKRFSYPTGIPYKADNDHLVRGIQTGYNLCNSTTEGPESLCQTAMVNSAEDFCLWGPPKKDSLIGDTEGESVAWCTKPGRGTRLIPAGALQGIQFMKAPGYVQVVGFIDQKLINIETNDYGGEMDPHGADLRGNPLGGLLYSNAFSGAADNFQQVVEWHNFMGANQFCIKACDQNGPDAPKLCEHIYDRIGCAFNAPNNAKNGTFESCKGENQDFPGIYTDTNGQVSTYKQPGEGTAPVLTWTARVPASSECVAHTSSVLFAALGTASAAPSGSASGSGSASASKPTGSAGSSPSRTASGSGASASATGTGNGAGKTAVSAFGLVGVLMSIALLV